MTDEDTNDLLLAELLDAEMRAKGAKLDELAKARLFKGIEGRLDAAPKRGQRLWTGPLAMAALLIVGLASFLFRPAAETTDGQRVKGIDLGEPVRLAAYWVKGDNSLEPVAGPNHTPAGATLVFKAFTRGESVIALAVARPDEAAAVRFVGTRPTQPGVETLLTQGDDAYGYRLEEGSTRPVRFCALAAPDLGRLADLTERLAGIFSALDAEACVTVTPDGG